ncbi:hypothetical protein [Streptomyces sp. NRRL S-241]|uniref:hypothetical protein n=1 Tax=Streptomyces sp. NRRL S-241 TaxID=1463896 RepID=UPI001F45A5EE|nr:hypothetical protein [Streptomyces sp. NRRL S-241]
MSVVRVIQDYQDELEADLLEFFQVDLLDLWRGRLSLRRVGVLINSLMKKPGRSTLLEAMDERTRWGESDYLLARISDALELSNYLFFKANAEDSDDLEQPDPIPRPGEPEPEPEPEETQFSSATELSTFLGQMNSL